MPHRPQEYGRRCTRPGAANVGYPNRSIYNGACASEPLPTYFYRDDIERCCARFTTSGACIRAVAAGSVTVLSADGSVCVGEIQGDGSYEVAKIAPGTAKVTVCSPDRTRLIGPERQALAQKGGGAKENEDGGGAKQSSRVNPPGWMKLPEKYAEVATSQLTTKVAGGTNTYGIPLN